ncbi:MAG: GNAT family N-acetyltransferase [Oscillospiraceae bacterium]|nr:GNAT family N-acetyltransferase [Oscillospiraceae bacterium]
MDEIELIFPTKAHELAARGYHQEHIAAGENELHGDAGLDSAESYDKWLEEIEEAQDIEIPSMIFFAFRKSDNKMIGTINVRHPYAGYVKIHGHIGYGVRPSERGKGYATTMLNLALAYCQELGLEQVLLTCDQSNIASKHIIIKCQGVFEGTSLQEDGNVLERYWINVPSHTTQKGGTIK